MQFIAWQLTKIKGYNGDIEILIPESYVVCDRKTNTWKMVVDVLVKKVVINFTYKEGAPAFTYTGNFEIANGDNADWNIRLLSSGTLTFLESPHMIDVFLVGGGGGGGTGNGNWNEASDAWYGGGGGGGGGGYATTIKKISVDINNSYSITVGEGGISQSPGKSTSAFGTTVNGGTNGKNGNFYIAAEPGIGGNSGGKGEGDSNYPGSAGLSGALATREFGEENGKLYAGGGGGGANLSWSSNGTTYAGGAGGGGNGGKGSKGNDGTPNTGGGGGGGSPAVDWNSGTRAGGTGGSGIVVIRTHIEDL